MCNEYAKGDLRNNVKELQSLKGKGYLPTKRKLVQSRVRTRKK